MVEKIPGDRFRALDYTNPTTRSRQHGAAGSYHGSKASSILPTQHPLLTPEPIATPSRTETRYKKNRKKQILLLVILLVVIAVGGFAFKEYKSNRNPIPVSIREQITFEPLYPTWLPEGFKLNKASYKYDSGVLTYSADTEGGKKVVFSVQKKPGNLDINKFYKQELENADEFSAPAGQAATGKLLGQQTASLVSGNSWLFIRPLDVSVSSDTLKQIALGVK